MTTSSSSPNNALSCLDGVAASAANLWLLIGRVLLGWLFLYSGWTKVINIGGAQAYLTNLKAPNPELLVYLSVSAEFGLGILLVLGIATRYASVLGMLFMIVATSLAHRYWEYPAAGAGRAVHELHQEYRDLRSDVLRVRRGPGALQRR